MGAEIFSLRFFDKKVWANKWFYVPKPSLHFSSNLSIILDDTSLWNQNSLMLSCRRSTRSLFALIILG